MNVTAEIARITIAKKAEMPTTRQESTRSGRGPGMLTSSGPDSAAARCTAAAGPCRLGPSRGRHLVLQIAHLLREDAAPHVEELGHERITEPVEDEAAGAPALDDPVRTQDPELLRRRRGFDLQLV